MPANKFAIPEELKDKIPGALLRTIQMRGYVYAFIIGLCFVVLGISRNGWIYFLGAVIGPVLLGLYLILVPLNLYHTPAAKFSGMADLDKRDPVARRLVTLMQSVEARRFLALAAIKLSGLLLLGMSIIAMFQPLPLTWSLAGEEAQWFLVLTVGCAILTLPIYATEVLLWSFRNWNSLATE